MLSFQRLLNTSSNSINFFQINKSFKRLNTNKKKPHINGDTIHAQTLLISRTDLSLIHITHSLTLVRDVCKDGVKVLRSFDYDKSLQLAQCSVIICEITFSSKYLQFSGSCLYFPVMGFNTTEKKNLSVYSFNEISIYRYNFMLFIKVLHDEFSKHPKRFQHFA